MNRGKLVHWAQHGEAGDNDQPGQPRLPFKEAFAPLGASDTALLGASWNLEAQICQEVA